MPEPPASAPTPANGSARLEVVRADDSHAAGIAEFIREVWNPEATHQMVLASRRESAVHNEAEPGVTPPTWLAVRADRVVGYVTTIPVRWWDGLQAHPAYWIKGLMVLPEFRNGPIGYALMKAAAAHLSRSAGLAVALPARRLFVALGYKDLGAIPNWIRPLSSARMLARLDLDTLRTGSAPAWARTLIGLVKSTGLSAAIGWIVDSFLRSAAAVLRLSGTNLRPDTIDPMVFADELTALWSRTRVAFPYGVVRDGTYLTRRYGATSGGPYIWLCVRRHERLMGVAILRRPRTEGDPRLHGIQVATLVELLYHPEDSAVGLALVGEVEKTARAIGADTLLASCSAPAMASVLRRQCYLRIPGNVHFLIREPGGQTSLGSTLDEWWLTRGDGQSDEVF